MDFAMRATTGAPPVPVVVPALPTEIAGYQLVERIGGGGYGDPAARQAARRDKDTALGYVSAPALLKGKE